MHHHRPAMPLTLERLTVDNVHETAPIRVDAFSDNPGVYAIRPNNNTPEVTEYYARKNQRTVQKPDHYMLGVRDDNSGELIAYAHWEFSRAENRKRVAEEPKKDDELAYPPGCRREAADEMEAGLDRGEKETMNQDMDYWHLHILGTKIAFRGRGAGKLLLNWGLEQATKDRHTCFLDSTAAGKPVYERMGFIPHKEWNIDYSKYGVNHWNRQWPMTWSPAGTSATN